MPLDLEVFVIRHVPTGDYLPARKSSRGFSNDEPDHEGGPLGPRIFATRRSAINALTAWLMGVHKRVGGGTRHVGTFGGNDEDYDEDIEIVPQPHRRREEMEIVPCHLIESVVDKYDIPMFLRKHAD